MSGRSSVAFFCCYIAANVEVIVVSDDKCTVIAVATAVAVGTVAAAVAVGTVAADVAVAVGTVVDVANFVDVGTAVTVATVATVVAVAVASSSFEFKRVTFLVVDFPIYVVIIINWISREHR